MFGRFLFSIVILGGLAIPALSLPQDNPAAAQATVPVSSNPAPVAAKKVWTNEDVSAAKGTVSVVGGKGNQTYHTAQPADSATVTRIKKSLDKLQTQLEDVNNKLKSYKQFQEGESVSTGQRDLSKGVSHIPVDQQIAQLEDKKKQLQDQIGDLLDEARKKGIDPGQLR